MDMMDVKINRKRRGSILVTSVILMMVLLIAGTAFLKWAAAENWQAEYDLAVTQAYYVAQHGVIERCVADIRSKRMADLPPQPLPLRPGQLDNYGDFIGHYESAIIIPITEVQSEEEENPFVKKRQYALKATGVVALNSRGNTACDVKRMVTMRAQMRTYANYMYLTDDEQTIFNEYIWFFDGDTLNGRLHSNSKIGIKGHPIFLGPVSTTEDDFEHGPAYDPDFTYEPEMEVPEVDFPDEADDVRIVAAQNGRFFENDGGRKQHRVTGSSGGWSVVRWDAGTPFPESNPGDAITVAEIPYGVNTVIFIEGQVEVLGHYIQGKTTIGCSGNMYLQDDIVVQGATGRNSYIPPMSSGNVLGLISEKNIVVANTIANGSMNGEDGANPNDMTHQSIIVTAALVALDESFSFEHQNDIYMWEWDRGHYNYCPDGYPPDERGIIYIRGAVAQKRRGYVQRSNCGKTGYEKSYFYDFRLLVDPPPVYLAAKDDQGNVFFDLTQSWDTDPSIMLERGIIRDY